MLSATVANSADLLRLLTELCSEIEQSGEVLLSTICALETPLLRLQEIKELAKTLLVDAQTEAYRAATILLYHLAVAAAFGRYGVNISSRSLDARLALYEDLATALGSDQLGNVFRRFIDRVFSL